MGSCLTERAAVSETFLPRSREERRAAQVGVLQAFHPVSAAFRALRTSLELRSHVSPWLLDLGRCPKWLWTAKPRRRRPADPQFLYIISRAPALDSEVPSIFHQRVEYLGLELLRNLLLALLRITSGATWLASGARTVLVQQMAQGWPTAYQSIFGLKDGGLGGKERGESWVKSLILYDYMVFLSRFSMSSPGSVQADPVRLWAVLMDVPGQEQVELCGYGRLRATRRASLSGLVGGRSKGRGVLGDLKIPQGGARSARLQGDPMRFRSCTDCSSRNRLSEVRDRGGDVGISSLEGFGSAEKGSFRPGDAWLPLSLALVGVGELSADSSSPAGQRPSQFAL